MLRPHEEEQNSSVTIIRRHLSSTACKFGFNELALENIQREFRRDPDWKTKPQRRWGTLMWDEISLKKDLTWQSNLLEWHGVVDYGPEITGSTQTGIASHCLVLLFRPYLGKWIQPIACFASLNAASGTLLHEIVTKAVVLLYKYDAVGGAPYVMVVRPTSLSCQCLEFVGMVPMNSALAVFRIQWTPT